MAGTLGMKWKKTRFKWTRDHDVNLYQLVLEATVWDERRDMPAANRKGGILLSGGWRGIAASMTERFGTKFDEAQVSVRMKLLEAKGEKDGDWFSGLFESAMDLRDDLESRTFKKRAADWFARGRSSSSEDDGLVEHEVTEADRPAGDRDPALPES